tara:strand:+ start:7596 stop:8924 length:1329 start_codon:yes stop_codon:yes gene_type:complete
MIKSDRTKNISFHIGWSFIYKFGSTVANFLLVPITIGYLNTTNYGVWITLSSFIGWFQFFDIGLGNGLRNKFAEARVIGDYEQARGYISTAYFTVGIISLILIAIFLSASLYVDWTLIFNTEASLKNELKFLLPITFSFFALQLVCKLIINIYQASQVHSINDMIQFISQLLSLFVIWRLTKVGDSSLLLFGSLFSALPVLILICFNFYAFNGRFKNLKPSLSKFSKKYFFDITGLGFNFFITKIGALILLTTDSFIISHLYGPSEVVPYNLAYKYFSILIILYSVVVSPYWSSFTEAYTSGDINWIKKSIGHIQKLWLLVPTCLIVMILLSEMFFSFWIGKVVVVPFNLSISMAIFVLFYTFNQIYNQFINGVGKIKLHVYISLLIIIFNIPLSIFLAKELDLNSSGIILASCLCLVLKIIFLPVQYKKIINNLATGIWDK